MSENELPENAIPEAVSVTRVEGDALYVETNRAELEVQHTEDELVPVPEQPDSTGKEEDEPDPEDEAFKSPKMYNPLDGDIGDLDSTAEATPTPITDYPKDFPTLYAICSILQAAVDTISKLPEGALPNTEQTRYWRETLGGALNANIHFNASALDPVVTRPAVWGTPVYESRKLSPGRSNAKADGGYYRGNAAVARVAAAVGLGQTVTYPLWSSGIWLTVKAPSNARLGELERKLVLNKDALGYVTSGMVFSNDAAYAIEILVNHILEDTTDCTVEGWDPELLKSLILSPDLQSLALAYAASIYTNGFPYSVPCTIDPKRCQHVSVEKLHLTKLLKADTTRLTAAQLKHMSTRSVKHTPEAIVAYQEQHELSKVGSVRLNDSLAVVFGVPTIRDYIDTAHRWIGSIEELTSKAFQRNLAGKEREDYMRQQMLLALTRQYSHWVKELVVTDYEGEEPVERIIDSRDDVDSSIGSLAADDDLTDTLIEAIGKFIADRTIAIAAIHNFQCPNCKHWHHTPLPNKLLLPVDTVSTFFTLMQFKLLNFKPQI